MLNFLHERTLEMFKSVVKVLERHGMNFIVCGGTLLGAITTGKFIPWDDDIDICIPENEFEDAKKYLIAELPDSMILQCDETEPNYYHDWLKVRDKNSEVFPKEKIYRYNGVWIDLYKLKKIPNDKIDFTIRQEHLKYLLRRHKGGITFKEMWKRIYENNLLQKLSVENPDSISGEST